MMSDPESRIPGTSDNSPTDKAIAGSEAVHLNNEASTQHEEKSGDKSRTAYQKIANYLRELEEEKPDRHIELALALAIVFLALVQLFTTRSNNKSTTQQTDQLIAAAKISAYAAQQNVRASESFAASAGNISDGVNAAVTKLQAQAAAVEASRETSEANSKAALDATIQNFDRDQRAWIGICDIPPVQLEDGKPILVSIKLCNTGRTPASKVKTRTKIRSEYILNFSPTDAEVDQVSPHNFESFPPLGGFSYLKFGDFSGGVTATTSPEQRALIEATAKSYEFVKAGKITIYYYGKIQYSDSFGQEHTTRFCIFIGNPETKEMYYCPEYNEMD